MAVMGGSGNLASDQVIINRLVRVFANTTIRASYSDTSRAIGTVSTEGEYRASLLQNGYYYIDDLGGWVIRARASTIRDDTPNATQSADGEYQSSVSQSTVQQISQFTEEERKDIYMEYINNEYGDVMNVDDVGDNIMVDNLNGIYGIPYQFTETVDPRPDNSSFGSIYASRIITRMPLLMLSPGKVDFMNRSTSGEKLAIFDALIGSENNSDTKLGDFIKKPGKYYTFAYDSENYWKYVNAMNNACAVYLGIQDVDININGVSGKAGSFHWEKATNDKFDSMLVSSESYVTFYADAETSKSEQYSNSTKASQLADTVNSFSDVAKEAMFLVGAHVGNISWVNAEDIDKAISQIGELGDRLLSGNGESLVKDIAEEFSVIATGGKLIFPEIWSDSEFTQSFDAKIKLRCPCPNKVSWFLDICVPINHLRALTLPRTPYGEGVNGKKFEDEPTANGYFSPFLVRGFYKGLWNCDMGIITDLSLSLGKEGSWTLDGLPSEVDVDMTIKDLYNVLAMTPSDQTTAFLNNTMFLNFLASSCGVSINKPDLDRSVDLYLMLKKNYWKDRLAGYSFWQKATQGIQNKLYNLYTGVFRG